jgi:hypothetical protein
MLTEYQIAKLPKGDYPNSRLRKMFGAKHGSPVKFQDKEGNVHTLISNRWWKRFRKRNPIIPAKASKQNIESEFSKVFGNKRQSKDWFGTFLKGIGQWFKFLFEKSTERSF